MAGNPLWTGDNISNSRLAAGTVGVVRGCQFINGPRCRLGDAVRVLSCPPLDSPVFPD